MEWERAERLEPARLILQVPESPEMIHDFLRGLDMSEEHGGVARDVQRMGDAMDLEPLLRGNLPWADLVPHAVGEHFRAATRDGVQAGVLQRGQGVRQGTARPYRQPMNLDRRQRLESRAGKHAADGSEQVEVVIEVQLRIQTADNVHVGKPPGAGLLQFLPDLRNCECIGPLSLILTPEGAEPALILADIRGVQVEAMYMVDVPVVQVPPDPVGPGHQLGGIRLHQQSQRLVR